ncbi:MAG: tyrosine-type recombinase/integrase, partial [Verrucomicrobiales bacterium]|nr:tyrosine-type recombinase/integrase [Verrucomicrobiales bacterium]
LEFLPEDVRTGNISLLTSDEIRDFKQREIEAGMVGGAINTKLSPIRQACSQAHKEKYINHDPAISVETLPEGESIKTIIPTGDLRRILATASDEWKGMILVGYFVGMHVGDASILTWGQVDLTKAEIEYKRTKTGKAVKSPIHPDLLNWLISRPAPDDPKAPVFPSLCGVSVGAANIGLSAQFTAILEKAGITGEVYEPTVKGGKGRKRKSIGFGSLRHSFNSAMANAEIPQEIRKKLTGHSTNSANDIYTHLERETLTRAVNAVPSIAATEGEDS